MSTQLPSCSYQTVRSKLLAREEIALLDVREEDPHAQAHPLFAAHFPLARIELDAYAKLPRKDVPIVTLDNGEGYAEIAATRLLELGYANVSVFSGGIQGWQSCGGELFRDVNVPSKSFGELVESKNHTPSLSAQQVKKLIDEKADVVVVDARRFDEYQTMSIPTGISVPGAELVLRLPLLAPNPATQVIVNCAGRTRSIIGTQSLINAGIPNPVAALRNGTMGWTLAGQELEQGQSRRFGAVSDTSAAEAATRARKVADRAGVKRAAIEDIDAWQTQIGRTSYFFDTRTAEEYEVGHIPGFRSVPGGQLVQEIEMVAPVRGARLVLVDRDGVRANMSASWLAQMAWEVCVIDAVPDEYFSAKGSWETPLPNIATVPTVSARELHRWLENEEAIVIDLSTHVDYVRAHIPGAWYALRSQLAQALEQIPKSTRYVLTCSTEKLAHIAARELPALTQAEVRVLAGGLGAWVDAGFGLGCGATKLASPPRDRYKRPYEGTDSSPKPMQAYLDWQGGLVEQLAKDGTHHFWVL